MSGSHEAFDRDEVVAGSDRSFGFVLSGFFVLIAAVRWWKGEVGVWLCIAVAAIPFCLALFWARSLRPLNQLWFRFGMLLYHVVSPIVMGLLFYSTVTPMALLVRILGKDLLRLRRDSAAQSYWIVRQPPGPSPESMKNQF
jgi:hypothetical protein